MDDFHNTLHIVTHEIARPVTERVCRVRILLRLLVDFLPRPCQDGEATREAILMAFDVFREVLRGCSKFAQCRKPPPLDGHRGAALPWSVEIEDGVHGIRGEPCHNAPDARARNHFTVAFTRNVSCRSIYCCASGERGDQPRSQASTSTRLCMALC